MKNKFMPYGLKHEVAKRWPVHDWLKSIKVTQYINSELAEQYIYELISAGKPALVGRLGGTEARFLGEFHKISSVPLVSNFIFKLKPNWIKRSREINTNAGFYFKNLDEARLFFDLYCEALCNTDILGAWGTAFSHIEGNFLDKVPRFIPIGWTAPWVEPYLNFSNYTPWVKSLEGKKVLVISPFAETIQKQFKRIGSVFPGFQFHNFELITLKPPVTLSNMYPDGRSWFELLEQTKSRMDNLDYQIALVSAGSYSYPLANHAKNMGRIGIHSGGGLQLFFGIMGKRWEQSEGYLKFVNRYWTRPSLLETPKSAFLVEGGCYW